MPQCTICNSSVSIFDVIKLKDGKCCPDCWYNATTAHAMLIDESKNMTAAQVRYDRDRGMARNLAKKTIDTLFEEKCKQIGIPHTELHFREVTTDKYCRYSFGNKTLYQIESKFSYHRRYDPLLTTPADIGKLVPLDFEYVAIPIDKIQYYAKEGDVQYTTKISGGGGGGSSISGAIVGGLVAGGAGAVIGSRQQVNPIKTTTQTHDSRKTILKYHDGDALVVMAFDGFDAYNFFQKNMPEKDLLSVQLQSSQEKPQNDDIREKLKLAKSLFEEGLIDEVEYKEKRQELLKLL